jgi:hypothetical protein
MRCSTYEGYGHVGGVDQAFYRGAGDWTGSWVGEVVRPASEGAAGPRAGGFRFLGFIWLWWGRAGGAWRRGVVRAAWGGGVGLAER